MTLFVDPNDPPGGIDRSGDAVFYQIASAGSDETDAVVIPIFTSKTVIEVITPLSGGGVRLPDDGQVGDEIRFCGQPGSLGYKVYLPNGDLMYSTLSEGSNRLAILFSFGWALV